jgi:hypothetical protein
MNTNDDLELKKWAADWQAAPYDIESAEQIRHYVKGRTGFFWSLAVADFVIGGIALPVLVYLGWATDSMVERMSMMGLTSITIATVMFGWWNRRGVLRSSATTTAEYLAISAERLRRLRQAWRIGWVVLAAQVIVFTIWIWDRLYWRAVPAPDGAAQFSWTWLIGFSALAIVGLVSFGRWINRDAARFEALKHELENDRP